MMNRGSETYPHNNVGKQTLDANLLNQFPLHS